VLHHPSLKLHFLIVWEPIIPIFVVLQEESAETTVDLWEKGIALIVVFVSPNFQWYINNTSVPLTTGTDAQHTIKDSSFFTFH